MFEVLSFMFGSTARVWVTSGALAGGMLVAAQLWMGWEAREERRTGQEARPEQRRGRHSR